MIIKLIPVVAVLVASGFFSINPQSLQPKPAPTAKIYNYSIKTRGEVSADLSEFRRMVAETLNDPRGWTRAGVKFQEAATDAKFTIILASPAEVKAAYPSVCSETLSCSVGNLVLINDDRWRLATDPWNAAGGNLRDYRHMVVNHEVGHFLGHPHEDCKTLGTPAPVMRQQSVDLQGCAFNPWPLASELWIK
jgi:hypothetical protein